MGNKSKNYAFAATLIGKPNRGGCLIFFRSIAQFHGDILNCENQPPNQSRNRANFCDNFFS
jgi:hypothetical protein